MNLFTLLPMKRQHISRALVFPTLSMVLVAATILAADPIPTEKPVREPRSIIIEEWDRPPEPTSDFRDFLHAKPLHPQHSQAMKEKLLQASRSIQKANQTGSGVSAYESVSKRADKQTTIVSRLAEDDIIYSEFADDPDLLPELGELAASLDNDPIRIYEWVRNNIETEFYGTEPGRGAVMAYLNRAGGDQSQCALLGALFRAAGYTPTYYRDLVYLPRTASGPNEVGVYEWLGVADDASALANIPFFNPVFTTGGKLKFLSMWISIDIPGRGTVQFLPHIKAHTRGRRPNLKTHSGYDRSTLFTEANATSTNPAYSGPINVPGLRSYLTTLVNNARTAILADSDLQNIGAPELAQLRTIIPEVVSLTDPLAECYPANATFEAGADPFTGIPAALLPHVRLKVGNNEPQWYDFCELRDLPLTIEFEANGNAVTKLNGVELDRETSGSYGQNITIDFSYEFPIGLQGGDSLVLALPITVKRASMMYLTHANGRGQGQLQQTLDEISKRRAAGGGEMTASEQLQIIGQQYMSQSYELHRLAVGVLGHDHRGGAMWGYVFLRNGKPVVHLGAQKWDFNNRVGYATERQALNMYVFDGALEGTAIEQLTGQRAYGTPTLFDKAFQDGHDAYFLTASNYDSITQSSLVNYSNDYLGTGAVEQIANRVKNLGYKALVLRDSCIAVSGQNIGGSIQESSVGTVASIISGFNGGVTPDPTPLPGTEPEGTAGDEGNETNNPANVTDQNQTTNNPAFTNDPVDLSNGAFVYDRDDLALGNDGFKISRHYSSARRISNPVGLGRGWTHNFDIRLSTRTPNDFDPLKASVPDVLPTLIAANVIHDLLASESSARAWMVACSAATWACDQQIKSRVSINLGARMLEFTRLPDGTYAAPGNLTATLTKLPDGSHELAFRHGNTIHFQVADGKFDTITDPFGNTITATYNADGTLHTVTDAYERTFTFIYAASQLTGITDSTGRSVGYAWNGNNFTFTDAEGIAQTLYMDSAFRLTKVEDARDRTVVENDYDDRDRVYQQRTFGDIDRLTTIRIVPGLGMEVDPEGGMVSTYFDARGRKIFTVDQAGQLSKWQYDGADRMVKTTTPKGFETSFGYNAAHVLISETNPAGHTRHITPDAWHRPSIVENFEEQTTAFEYWNNTSAKIKKITAPGDIVTEFTYDAKGRLSTAHPASYAPGVDNIDTYAYDDTATGFGNLDKITHPDDGNTVDQDFDDYRYNARGDLLELIDRKDVKTTYTYNARRQVTSVTQGEGSAANTIQTFYDDAGDVDYTIDASGRKVDSEHDALGHLTQIKRGPIDSQVITLTNSYSDLRTLLTSSTIYPVAGTSLTTEYTYYATQKLATSQDPLDRTTTFGYDDDQRPVTVRSPLGTVAMGNNDLTYATSTTWDERGFKVGVTDPEADSVSYTYDKDGRMVRLGNRLTNDFTWDYNDATRTVTSKTPRQQPGGDAEDLSTIAVRNTRGLPASVEEPSGDTTTFSTYDNEGRLLQKIDDVGTTTYTYWANGLPKEVTENGHVTYREYDELNRLRKYQYAALNPPDPVTVIYELSYTYYPSGELHTIVYPGNKTVTYTYDDFGRLSTVTDWATPARTTTYGYDNASRLTRIDRSNGTYRVQSYDAASQLHFIKEFRADHSHITFQELKYDEDGRVKSSFVHPMPASITLDEDDLLYDDDNRLSTWNTQSIIFDDDGNMITGPLLSSTLVDYDYDSRNRLTSAGGSTYHYNPDGLRVEMTGTGAATFVIDPNAALTRTLIRTKGGVTTYYVYGLGLLYEETNGETLTYHVDQVGSTMALTDGSGTVTDRWTYKPFGAIAEHTVGTSDTPFQFNGAFGVQTDDNGLCHMRARYYNPQLMRFCNADPIGFDGGVNWYVYVENNPVSRTDPRGLFGWGLGVDASGTFGLGFTANTSSAKGEVGVSLNGTASAAVGTFIGDKVTIGSYVSSGTSTKTGDAQGISGGASVMGFLTNANKASDLNKTTDTVIFNIGFGVDLGISLSWGNGIWIIEVAPPGSSVGGGIGGGELTTTTHGGTILGKSPNASDSANKPCR